MLASGIAYGGRYTPQVALYLDRLPREGWCIVFWCSPFAPPDRITPDEYRGYLRALYRRDPHLFGWWCEEARHRDLTLVDTTGDGLADVLYDALCKVAQTRGYSIDGRAGVCFSRWPLHFPLWCGRSGPRKRAAFSKRD